MSSIFFCVFSLPRFSPQGIVLQRLPYSFLDLFCAKTAVGTRELFPALPHKGDGIKCLLLHGFIP